MSNKNYYASPGRAKIMYRPGMWAFVCLLWSVSPIMAAKAADSVPREELISAYIFNLARNVTWPDERRLKNFHIHVIERDSRLGPVLKRLVRGLEIKGLPVTVTTTTDPARLPEDAQLVYLGKGLRQFNSTLIARTEGRPVLVISYGAKDQSQIMIDLYQDAARRIHFRINQKLLKNRKLAITPDLIVLGGREIAVNRLFKSTLEKLREQQQHIEANRLTLERMKREIADKRVELEKKRREISRLKQQDENFREELTLLKTSLEEKTADLQTLQHELLQARQSARDLKLQSEQYASELREQRGEIEARNKVLADQRKTISRLDHRIQDQKQKISAQMKVLTHQSAQLRQWATIVILSTGLTLFALFFMGFFFWQRRRYQRLSRELALACDVAETASQAKSVFLANMSHELRTPLNAILGFTDILLKNGERDPERKQYLKIVHKSGQFLLSLIDDVLNLSRVEAGKMALEPQTVQLHSLILDVVDLVRERAAGKGLTLETQWENNDGPIICVDAGKLKQIILNLLSNAIKYTDRGGITLRVGLKEEWLNIEVEDTGKGIAPADRERIFEPFVQTGSASSNTGTGLGLSIVRQYARLMGGDVTVHSQVGKGSVFRVSIPYEPGSQSEQANDSTNHKERIIGLAPGQKSFRILIVDDRKEARLLLRKLIEDLKLPVMEAENGLEAVEIFKKWRPHLIWMDQRMPVMSGEEATRKIRELPGGRDVYIIALTASFQREKRQQLLEAGMDELVAKPYHLNEIYAVMERYLGLRYLRERNRESGADSDGKITSDALRTRLAELEPERLDELYDAAVLLNRDEMARALKRIEPLDPELVKMLNTLVENMQYGELLMAIRESPNRSA